MQNFWRFYKYAKSTKLNLAPKSTSFQSCICMIPHSLCIIPHSLCNVRNFNVTRLSPIYELWLPAKNVLRIAVYGWSYWTDPLCSCAQCASSSQHCLADGCLTVCTQHVHCDGVHATRLCLSFAQRPVICCGLASTHQHGKNWCQQVAEAIMSATTVLVLKKLHIVTHFRQLFT